MGKLTLAKAGIIGLGLFIVYKIIAKGSAASNLTFKIGKVAYTFSGSGFILTFFVIVKNTTAEKILLNSIKGDILFNEEKVGEVDNKLEIFIEAEKETTLPIAVNLFYGPAVKVITDLIEGKLSEASTFNFKGVAKVEGLEFPLDIKYTLA